MKIQDHALDSKVVINDVIYIVTDKIIVDRVRYYLLKNPIKNNDIIIRKTNELALLNSDNEFDKIYRLFTQRNTF